MAFLNSVMNFLNPILDRVSFVKHPAFWLAMIFVAAVIYSLYAKARDGKNAKKDDTADKTAAVATKNAAAAGTPLPANTSAGSLDLIDVDEKTAAVIMAIVSNKSGIPLNRLSFKSIRLMEDK